MTTYEKNTKNKEAKEAKEARNNKKDDFDLAKEITKIKNPFLRQGVLRYVIDNNIETQKEYENALKLFKK